MDIKAIFFALVVFALIASILFRSADLGRIGAAALPIIFIVCGISGFIFGWRPGRKQ
jgi:hypothetical protein